MSRSSLKVHAYRQVYIVWLKCWSQVDKLKILSTSFPKFESTVVFEFEGGKEVKLCCKSSTQCDEPPCRRKTCTIDSFRVSSSNVSFKKPGNYETRNKILYKSRRPPPFIMDSLIYYQYICHVHDSLFLRKRNMMSDESEDWTESGWGMKVRCIPLRTEMKILWSRKRGQNGRNK